MDITPIDPRDTRWEHSTAVYRVYFWDGGTSSEYEIRNADVPEVLAWADEEGGRLGCTYMVWLCAETSTGRGLIRLAGREPDSDAYG